MLEVKKDFPILKNNPKLIYLDNAATSQKPKIVIKTISDFLKKENSNVQRGLYTISEKAMKKFDKARGIISNFINSEKNSIIFTKNTTESINLLAYTINSVLPKEKNKNEIVLTEMEHHSNLVPWQQFAKRNNFKLKFIKLKKDFTLDYADAKQKINKNTAIVSVIHASNVLGTVNDIENLIKLTKKNKAISIIDAAQSITHMKIDVKRLNCDFLVFSSHKVLGPTGIGILYGKKDLLEKLIPFQFGGGMINKVTKTDSTWAEIPEKFEAGTQNISEAIAFSKAIEYLNKIGIGNTKNHIKELTKHCLEKLKETPNIEIYNPGYEKSIGIISFNIKGIHPHDIASLLNDDGIAIRAGHHCAMPLMETLGINGTARVSFQIYNSKQEINKLIESLKKISKVFKNE